MDALSSRAGSVRSCTGPARNLYARTCCFASVCLCTFCRSKEMRSEYPWKAQTQLAAEACAAACTGHRAAGCVDHHHRALV